MKPNVMRIFGPEDISSCHCTAKRSRLPDPAYKYSSIAIIQPPLGHQVMGGGGGGGVETVNVPDIFLKNLILPV